MTVFSSPCHTKGHVLYYLEAKVQKEEKTFGADNKETAVVNRAVFTGDTIFVGGVGKFFEGNAEQMARNIAWVKTLPPTTAVFCGHDYAEGNFKFALKMEPENPEYLKFYEQLIDNAQNGTHKLPSTVEQECKSNVFFRHDIIAHKFSPHTSSIESLGLIRQYKDEGKSLH